MEIECKNKISVAIATYNGEKYLREQLDSLYNQTRVPDEVFVSDDGSTDGTIAILEEYHQIYGLKYEINKGEHGVNKNFEKAIRNCTGDYIAICDQDDVWMSHKVEKSLSILCKIEGNGPACISSKCINVDKNLKQLSSPPKMNDTYGYKASFLQNGVAQGCSLMFNRKLLDILKPIPDYLMYDAYIGYVAASVGNKYNISEPLMYYRHHDSNVIGRLKNNKNIILRIKEHLKMWKYSPLFDYKEYDYIKEIFKTYAGELYQDRKDFLNELLIFEKSDIFKKIHFILNEKYYKVSKRVSIAMKLFFTYWMPL